MIYNNVILEVAKQTDIETIRALLRRQGELSRQEPGCSRFEVYQSQTERSLFMLIEQWETSGDASGSNCFQRDLRASSFTAGKTRAASLGLGQFVNKDNAREGSRGRLR